MQQRLLFWLIVLAALIITGLWGGALVIVQYAGPVAATVSNPLYLYALLASVAVAAAVGVLRLMVQRQLVLPVKSLVRDIDTLLQAKQVDRALRIPSGHSLLDGLPESIGRLVDELRNARREGVRAMATAAARAEREKSWLEVILLELVREGVLVCSSDHRLLLYNQPAARLFSYSHALGLGRSLFDLIAEEPVRHALERVEHRLQSGQRDLHTPFVCATRDASSMLRARLALILDDADRPNGYVVTLEDISAELAGLQRQEALRRSVTRDLRGPLGSLRAAAESLKAFPDIDGVHRQAFQDIIYNESTLLSQRIDALAAEDHEHGVSWPMTEIHSPDLFSCIARHLREQAGVELVVGGEAQWLKGDSHALMLVLIALIERLAQREELQRLTIAAALVRNRVFIELRWVGQPVSGTTLSDWLSAALPALSGTTALEVLERHDSEPWSQVGEGGDAILRIPLPAPPPPQVQENAADLPPRPEFYDFDLMNAHSFAGELGKRRLKDLTFVVFDTETTGLKPANGDEIIQIAAVRVTKGRVLAGETFDSLVNPGRSIPKDSIRFHGITDEQVQDQPPLTEVLPQFHLFAGDAVLVAHNAAFDMKFLKLKEARCGVTFENPVIDTLLLSLLIEGYEENHSLDGICERLNIVVEHRHSALGDTLATAHVLVHLLDRLEARGIHTFEQVMRASNMEAEIRFRAGHF